VSIGSLTKSAKLFDPNAGVSVASAPNVNFCKSLCASRASLSLLFIEVIAGRPLDVRGYLSLLSIISFCTSVNLLYPSLTLLVAYLITSFTAPRKPIPPLIAFSPRAPKVLPPA